MGRSPRTVQQFEIYHSPVFLSPRARSTDKKASRLDYYIKCKYSRDKEITLLTTSLPPPLPPPYSLSLEKLLVLCLSLTFYPIPPPPSRIKSIRCFPRDLRLFRGSLESASSSSRREGPTRKSKGKHGCYLGSFPSPLRRSAADSCFNEEEWAGAWRRETSLPSSELNNSDGPSPVFDRLLFREVSRFKDYFWEILFYCYWLWKISSSLILCRLLDWKLFSIWLRTLKFWEWRRVKRLNSKRKKRKERSL